MKKGIAVLLILCVLFSLSACDLFSKEVPVITRAEEPEGWDREAEFLKFINGFFWSQTADEMRQYCKKGTTQKQMQQTLDLYSEFRRYQNGDFPKVYDYPYDSVKLTYLENYKGYDIFRAVVKSSAYEAAVAEYKAQQPDAVLPICSPVRVWALTIEDGKYVACLNERLKYEINGKCSDCGYCFGEAGVLYPVPSDEVCTVCNGEGYVEAHCNDCGAKLATATTPCECGATLVDKSNWQCAHCRETGKEPIFEKCPECDSKGYTYHVG